MLLCVNQKLFLECLYMQDCPTSLYPVLARLTTYNGTSLSQLGTQDNPIELTSADKWVITPHAHTWWYIGATPSTAILGFPCCSKLQDHMNCVVKVICKTNPQVIGPPMRLMMQPIVAVHYLPMCSKGNYIILRHVPDCHTPFGKVEYC